MTRPAALAALFLAVSSAASGLSPQTLPAPVPKSDMVDVGQMLKDLQVLSADDMEGRKAGTTGNAKAREYVVQRFRASGITPLGASYLYPFDGGVNVAGYVKGEKYPDKFLVVSAHYDHVGIQKGSIYNGADDNASGVAALFALATHFNKNRPENSILFVAFDSEEGGLHGSQAFLRAPAVPKSAMVFNINVDMIGRDSRKILYVVGTHTQPALRPFVETVISRSRVKLVLGHDVPGTKDDDWTNDSDHYSFKQQGIPFLFFSVEDYEYYHTPNDDYGSMMPDFYVGCVEAIGDMIQVIDRSLRTIG